MCLKFRKTITKLRLLYNK